MRGLTIAADAVFDGERWSGAATVRCVQGRIAEVEAGLDPTADVRADRLLPGLVDVGVSASGYAELPDDASPYAPEEAFARLCLRHGVTTVVDVENSAGPLSWLAELERRGRGPLVLHSAGRLASEPRGRHDVVVGTDDAVSAVAAVLHAGGSLVSLGLLDVQGQRAVQDAARAAGLPVLTSRPTTPRTPGSTLEAPDGSTFVVPQLLATRRWTVDGLLGADDAHLAAPVLPHCRHFARSRGRWGRAVARPLVGRYYGDRDPALLPDRPERGVGDALRAGRCLASSGAGATGLVPGLSLWDEIGLLAALGGDDAALRSATSAPATALGRADLGRVRVGARADLLLLGPGAAVPTVDDLRAVVLAGHLVETSELSTEVDDLVTVSLRGA